MFAVMKHFDVMLGIDLHICWPPPAPKPIGPKPYLTIMLLHGLQPLTPMMAPSCLTLAGMTMQRGTDIGPGIPHIGPASKLTPIDVLFSSSISYFGPSTYAAEAMPVAAALAMGININANCWHVGPIPSGIVICPTTHFTGMTPLDILFGVVSYGVDFAFEAATDKLADVLGPALRKHVIGPISDKLTAKLASKSAADVAGGASAKTASEAAGKASPQLGAQRRTGPAAGPATGPRPPGKTPMARPAGAPTLAAHRSPPARPRTPAGPSRPPPHVWKPGKPNPQQRPTGRPTLGDHRVPDKGPSLWEIYRDVGYDALIELLLEVPMAIPQQFVADLLPLSGIEEFGAPRDEQDG
ncbi:hypothetical protein [Nannocystis bainbridge]|uniref:Uncharacterized protein n=1 Tax=Nannocystis bainbridge TaxID=2995303 RepID=A0ABT5EFL0_9BACT|nr:hypothetical protein [Nannocystis bainbridge]MDC0723587.1 hypothetical protein [Nannocystis bainbridge]